MDRKEILRELIKGILEQINEKTSGDISSQENTVLLKAMGTIILTAKLSEYLTEFYNIDN